MLYRILIIKPLKVKRLQNEFHDGATYKFSSEEEPKYLLKQILKNTFLNMEVIVLMLLL